VDVGMLGIFIAFLALAVSIWQGRQTTKALKQDFQFEQAETVHHFSHIYLQDIETDDEVKPRDFDHEKWSSKYWGLLNMEFYFFDTKVIPERMFALWMADLAEQYEKDSKAWESHHKFLEFYETIYPNMKTFFTKIHEFSEQRDIGLRHEEIWKYVQNWEHESGFVMDMLEKIN
jgi:hypothetical protein